MFTTSFNTCEQWLRCPLGFIWRHIVNSLTLSSCSANCWVNLGALHGVSHLFEHKSLPFKYPTTSYKGCQLDLVCIYAKKGFGFGLYLREKKICGFLFRLYLRIMDGFLFGFVFASCGYLNTTAYNTYQYIGDGGAKFQCTGSEGGQNCSSRLPRGGGHILSAHNFRICTSPPAVNNDRSRRGEVKTGWKFSIFKM